MNTAAIHTIITVFQRGKYFDSKKKIKGAGGKMKKGRRGEVELVCFVFHSQ